MFNLGMDCKRLQFTIIEGSSAKTIKVTLYEMLNSP